MGLILNRAAGLRTPLQIHFLIWTNKFFDLKKYILQFEEIHRTIWRNTFWLLGPEYGPHLEQGETVHPSPLKACFKPRSNNEKMLSPNES